MVFITSLEFMPDAKLAIKEAARVAEKGLIFGLMNKNSPSTIRKSFSRRSTRFVLQRSEVLFNFGY